MKRIFNFSAGPAILPTPVLEEASRGVLEIAEIRECGSWKSVIAERSTRRSTLTQKSASFACLAFRGRIYGVVSGGGASLQFAMLPMNFLRTGQTADYVNTGEWAVKAIKEAKRFGSVKFAGSSEEGRFSYIPRDLSLTPGARYVHITTNNTIEGTHTQASRRPGRSA